MAQRFKLLIEYDGRAFIGWQSQASTVPGRFGVQEILERAVAHFDPRCGDQPPITVMGSGRTDSGVHGRGQVAHVDICRDMDAKKLMGAINHLVRPWPVAVLDVQAVPDEFHARFGAVQRHYLYRVINRISPLSIEQGLAWHVRSPLDIEKMEEGARHLIGHHDFTTFRHVECQAKSPMKTLDYLEIERRGEEVDFHVGARSFLHHQVRSMVGVLKLVGQGKWTPEQVKLALEARDRQALGLNAPPDGLYFMAVDYGVPSRASTAPLS